MIAALIAAAALSATPSQELVRETTAYVQVLAACEPHLGTTHFEQLRGELASVGVNPARIDGLYAAARDAADAMPDRALVFTRSTCMIEASERAGRINRLVASMGTGQ